jgi:hypothetical protein
MALAERTRAANDGVVIFGVAVVRVRVDPGTEAPSQVPRLKARVRVTTRAMWLNNGELLDKFEQARAAPEVRAAACCACFGVACQSLGRRVGHTMHAVWLDNGCRRQQERVQGL